MKAKKLLAFALAGTMMISLAACGGSKDSSTDSSSSDNSGDDSAKATVDVVTPNTDPANTEKTDEELKIGLASEPSTLYGPAGGKTENEEQIINAALLETLVHYNYSTNEIEPALATEWEWVDDTHLKFTLRDGVTMSDGTPLTADDVVYTCNEIWLKG